MVAVVVKGNRFAQYCLLCRVLLLLLCSSLLLLDAVVEAVEQGSFASYFGGSNHDSYVAWTSSSEGAYYKSSLYLPSADNETNGAAIHWNVVVMNSSNSSSSSTRSESSSYLELAVVVRATGWVGFGLSDNGGMTGSDILIVETANPDVTMDAFVTDERYPQMDALSNDWIVTKTAVVTEDGFCIVQVTRPLATPDCQDRAIVNDASWDVPVQRVIAAWGDDVTYSYHGPRVARGAIRWMANVDLIRDDDDAAASVTTRQATTTAVIGDEAALFQNEMELYANGHFDVIMDNYPVPAQNTLYMDLCFTPSVLLQEQGLDVLNLEGSIIGFEPVVTSGKVHHFTVYASRNENEGADCVIRNYYDMIYVWGPGEPPLALPLEVGVPLGGSTGFKSFKIEYHYDNPTLESGILDSSGLKFYYSTTKRRFDMGVLQLGDPFVKLGKESVGTGITKHSFECPSTCSDNALSEPVTVLREYLHMHMTGVASTNQLYDTNGNLVHTGSTQYFDFHQQGVQVVAQEPFVVYPGDSWKTDCYYSNDDSPDLSFGTSSSAEMCIAYLMYYPAQSISLNQQFPWTCAYELPIQGVGCGSNYVPKLNAELDLESTRIFGRPSLECGGGTAGAPTTSNGTTNSTTTGGNDFAEGGRTVPPEFVQGGNIGGEAGDTTTDASKNEGFDDDFWYDDDFWLTNFGNGTKASSSAATSTWSTASFGMLIICSNAFALLLFASS